MLHGKSMRNKMLQVSRV